MVASNPHKTSISPRWKYLGCKQNSKTEDKIETTHTGRVESFIRRGSGIQIARRSVAAVMRPRGPGLGVECGEGGIKKKEDQLSGLYSILIIRYLEHLWMLNHYLIFISMSPTSRAWSNSPRFSVRVAHDGGFVVHCAYWVKIVTKKIMINVGDLHWKMKKSWEWETEVLNSIIILGIWLRINHLPLQLKLRCCSWRIPARFLRKQHSLWWVPEQWIQSIPLFTKSNSSEITKPLTLTNESPS